MCFRPTEIAIKMKCADCGKRINPVAGVLPQKCPFCESTNPFVPEEDMAADAENAAAPAAPAPAAPAAPAPAAPAAPVPPKAE